jgi:hypothetical protein
LSLQLASSSSNVFGKGKVHDEHFVSKLIYLSKIFEKFNTLNTSMQGNDTDIVVTDKVKALIGKLGLWVRKIEGKSLHVFSFEGFCGGKECETSDAGLNQCIKDHLVNL